VSGLPFHPGPFCPSSFSLGKGDSQSHLPPTRVEPDEGSEGVLPPAKGRQLAVHSVCRRPRGRRLAGSNATRYQLHPHRLRLPAAVMRPGLSSRTGVGYGSGNYPPDTQQVPFGSRPSPRGSSGDRRSEILAAQSGLSFSFATLRLLHHEAGMRLHLIPRGSPQSSEGFSALCGIS
jgi:hypothetical protein